MEPFLPLPIVLVASSVLSVLGALLLAGAVDRMRALRGGRPAPGQTEAVFLIAEEAIIDANAAGQALLAALNRQTPAAHAAPGPRLAPMTQPVASWQRLRTYLAGRFPNLDGMLQADGASGVEPEGGDGSAREPWQIAAADASGRLLSGMRRDGTLRLTLGWAPAAAGGEDVVRLDPLSWQALNEELELLRRTNEATPVPAWREAPGGRITWANGAYVRLLAETGRSGPLDWPLPPLFEADATLGSGPRAGRHSLPAAGSGAPRCFDLISIDEGAARLVFALPADEAQRAERAKRDFVQTLSRTFATLPIGLAVFDRTRRLQLFNPALADLTGLEPEFLASRPGLEGVLNRMRDKHVMPEPRDYRSWARRLLDVELVATGAGFEETWALADGRTFRVSATPHPDGALALLIEDVTSDMRLKRSYRAELEAGRAALDLVDDGIAIFDAGGTLLITNAAFDRIWIADDAEPVLGVRFEETVERWRAAGGDPAFWDRLAALARPGAPTLEVTGAIRLEGAGDLAVRARRAPGGGVMVCFAPVRRDPQRGRTPPTQEALRPRRAIG